MTIETGRPPIQESANVEFTGRIEGYDKFNPDAVTYSVQLRPEASDFLRALVHTEVAAEVNAGNLPVEGEEDSLAVDLQRRLAIPNASYELSEEDVQYLKTVMRVHKNEGRLDELPEGFNPMLELDLGFSNALNAERRNQRYQVTPENRVAQKASKVYHNLLERLKAK